MSLQLLIHDKRPYLSPSLQVAESTAEKRALYINLKGVIHFKVRGRRTYVLPIHRYAGSLKHEHLAEIYALNIGHKGIIQAYGSSKTHLCTIQPYRMFIFYTMNSWYHAESRPSTATTHKTNRFMMLTRGQDVEIVMNDSTCLAKWVPTWKLAPFSR